MQNKTLSLNRRQFIKIAGSMAVGANLMGCNANTLLNFQPQLDVWPTETTDANWRLLNRLTFGPRPEERDRLAQIGPGAFVEEQLAPETLPDMALKPRLTLRRRETLHLDVPDLFDIEADVVRRELQQATLLQAVYSSRQLYEIMVDFWSNHFNIDHTKAECAWLKTVDDRDVIRRHALSNFYDLLYASAHSPAMLIYLDNQENHVGNPNENYARELLELHTVGIDSGYTQNDIQELARCLTGWTVKQHFYRGRFTFNADQHDNSPKQIMGVTIPANIQQSGGEQIIDMLAAHPATAHFIAAKLVRRFVADNPPANLVAQAAQTFIDTQGDIKAILRTILLSSEVINPGPDTPRKLKRPFDYVASALRQLNADTNAAPALLNYLAEMGQPLFQWPTPDGFPDHTEAWNVTLLTRWRFALALVNNQIPGTTLDLQALVKASAAKTATERLAQFAILLLGRPLPNSIAHQLLQSGYSEKSLLATLLGSPAFQWK